MTARAVDTVRSALDRIAGQGPLGIACSGGGDSLALLVMASEWARDSGRDLHVLTVDHCLRSTSGDEAKLVARMASRLGWPCSILYWDDARVGGGLQSRARSARHRLLAKACRENGLTGLALGHTRDDQSETLWLRLAAGGSWRSAAAMGERTPSPAWPEGRDLELLRPCLGVTRSELRDVLRGAGVDWVDDPSNKDDRFARIRARSDLERLRQAGFDTDRFAALADQLGPIQAVERQTAWRCGQTAVTLHDWGGASLDGCAWSGIAPAARLTILDALVTAVSGQPASPSRGRLEPLDAAILAVGPLTGCGVRLWAGSGGTIWLVRDRGAVLGRVDHHASDPWTGEADGTRIFDGRFEISAGARNLDWGILGETYDGLSSRAILKSVPGVARAGLLVARDAGQVVMVAGMGPVSTGLPKTGGATDRPIARSLIAHRYCRRLLSQKAVGWFDEPEMA
ncbi:tRNA lysidine(34) synthetase TilS [Maricaulis sp.]|uniref:tRNA lysidine(34) synthetase TilS n=1 Tax=Maricaulis sp. TaxID=1486257 RepID=UPI002B26C881|nr:tRNA lysidine(34) synthetase TilS [Maricaulis sp.]